MVLCWWCGDLADSREHKWPRALLVLEFGEPTEWLTEPVAHVYNNINARVNGPRAKSLTFAPVICRRCNNDRSAPFDRAMIAFGRHVKFEGSELLRSRTVDWSIVDPGIDAVTVRRNFTGFMVKFVGCCLAEAGVDVPSSFPRFLSGSSARVPELHLVMNMRRDIADLLDHESRAERSPMGAVWSGGISSTTDPDNPNCSMTFGHFTFRFVRVSWALMPHRNDGGTNYDSEVVEVPLRWNLEPADYPWLED